MDTRRWPPSLCPTCCPTVCRSCSSFARHFTRADRNLSRVDSALRQRSDILQHPPADAGLPGASTSTVVYHPSSPDRASSSSQTQIQQQTQQTQRRSLFSPYLPAASLPPLLAAGKLVIGVLRVNKRVRCRLLWRSAELARVLMYFVLLRTEPIRRLRRHRGSRCRHLRASSAFTSVARFL